MCHAIAFLYCYLDSQKHLFGVVISDFSLCSCNEIGMSPCHCRSKQYKVLIGSVINCISVKDPWHHSYGCQEKCHGRKHDWENEIAFPKREAYACVRPIAGKQFITEHHVIQDCRRCQQNEIASGCTCYADRHCECPKETHYVDVIGDCLPKKIRSSSKITVSSSAMSAVQNTIDLKASRNSSTLRNSIDLTASSTLSATSASYISPTPSSTSTTSIVTKIDSVIYPTNLTDSVFASPTTIFESSMHLPQLQNDENGSNNLEILILGIIIILVLVVVVVLGIVIFLCVKNSCFASKLFHIHLFFHKFNIGSK